LECTPEIGHKELGVFGTDRYLETGKGMCHESETKI